MQPKMKIPNKASSRMELRRKEKMVAMSKRKVTISWATYSSSPQKLLLLNFLLKNKKRLKRLLKIQSVLVKAFSPMPQLH